MIDPISWINQWVDVATQHPLFATGTIVLVAVIFVLVGFGFGRWRYK